MRALRKQRLGSRRANSESDLCISKTGADGLGHQIVEGDLAGLEPDGIEIRQVIARHIDGG